jgi:orotidine-5'-phosphate decarboxylase
VSKPGISPADRLIVALDVPTADEARQLVERLDGAVSFFKIGLILHTACGLELVKWLVARGNKVFLDLKFFDVRQTVKGAVASAANLGAAFLTIHGNREIIEGAVEGRGESDLKLLAVTVLTNFDATDIRDLGFPVSVEELVLHRARSAVNSGCDGVVSSPNEVAAIREALGQEPIVVTPGIRPPPSAADEQKRIATPHDAILSGSDYLVVGRPIRTAPDPRDAALAIIDEMERAVRELAENAE